MALDAKQLANMHEFFPEASQVKLPLTASFVYGIAYATDNEGFHCFICPQAKINALETRRGVSYKSWTTDGREEVLIRDCI